MKKLSRIVLLLWAGWLLPCLPAHAGSFTLKWDADARATAYSVYTSTNQGTTWTKLRDVTTPTTVIVTPTDAPDNALILMRVSAKNAAGETIRTDSGIWLNTAWSPLQVVNVGVQ